MRVLYFCDDYASEKGMNHEVRLQVEGIEKKAGSLNVRVLSKSKKEKDSNVILCGKVIVRHFDYIRAIKTYSPDVLFIRGLLSFDVFFIMLVCWVLRIKYVLAPCSQINAYNLNRKLFFEDPSIAVLKGAHDTSNLFLCYQYIVALKKVLFPFVKRVMFYCFGWFFVKKSSGVIFASEYEKECAVSLLGFSPCLDAVIPEMLWRQRGGGEDASCDDIYISNALNVVYWGRLDHELKGIDRVLQYAIANPVCYFHLMGPDYNGGKIKILETISRKKISNVIVHDESVWKNRNELQACADYSILFSRWDGFPRALRESLSLNVPIIVSKETNFEDVVSDFGCGFVVSAFDSSIDMTVKLENHKAGCKPATTHISVDSVVDMHLRFIDKVLGI